MKRQPIIWGIILLFLLSNITPIVFGVKNIQSPIVNDDVEISIKAGLMGKTNGDYGFGWIVCITNNINQSFTVILDTFWYTLKGEEITRGNTTFNLEPYTMDTISGGVIFSPNPIHKITLQVNVSGLIVTRSGLEIGCLVFFPKGDD